MDESLGIKFEERLVGKAVGRERAKAENLLEDISQQFSLNESGELLEEFREGKLGKIKFEASETFRKEEA